MKKLKEAHEAQLVALSRQLLELECGLRKRERELCADLQQRDRVIREQAHIIQFLTKKTGTKRSDILTLADEAVAKIPQWNQNNAEQEGGGKPSKSDSKDKRPPVMITKAKSEITLTSILESESENDSAIILDDMASPTTSTASKSVSRSVSDVMSAASFSAAEASPESNANSLEKSDSRVTNSSSPFASPNYRGFLLRHGSYERYKIRSRMQQLHNHSQHSHHAHDQDLLQRSSPNIMSEYAQIAANATLPRTRNKKKTSSSTSSVVVRDAPYAVSQSLSRELCSSSTNVSTTVIVINGNNDTATTNNAATNSSSANTTSTKLNSNHRSVTKPRDVKNKSSNRTKTKMILRMNSPPSSAVNSPPNSKSPSPPMVITEKLIHQSGSVYCSLFGGGDILSDYDDDLNNHSYA